MWNFRGGFGRELFVVALGVSFRGGFACGCFVVALRVDFSWWLLVALGEVFSCWLWVWTFRVGFGCRLFAVALGVDFSCWLWVWTFRGGLGLCAGNTTKTHYDQDILTSMTVLKQIPRFPLNVRMGFCQSSETQ